MGRESMSGGMLQNQIPARYMNKPISEHISGEEVQTSRQLELPFHQVEFYFFQ